MKQGVVAQVRILNAAAVVQQHNERREQADMIKSGASLRREGQSLPQGHQ
jgi:hypothetical protein